MSHINCPIFTYLKFWSSVFFVYHSICRAQFVTKLLLEVGIFSFCRAVAMFCNIWRVKGNIRSMFSVVLSRFFTFLFRIAFSRSEFSVHVPKMEKICAYRKYNLALTWNGVVYAWKSPETQCKPVRNLPACIVDIALGTQHCVAVTRGGLVYTWGSGR